MTKPLLSPKSWSFISESQGNGIPWEHGHVAERPADKPRLALHRSSKSLLRLVPSARNWQYASVTQSHAYVLKSWIGTAVGSGLSKRLPLHFRRLRPRLD